MAKRIAIVVLLLVLIAAGVSWFVWTRTPQYSLRKAADAFEEHDLVTFQQYVDTEKLSARFVDDMLAVATRGSEKEGFAGLAAGMLMMMRPQMVKAAQDSLERSVETGHFEAAQTGTQGGSPADATAPYWKKAKPGESGYQRLAYVKKQGKIALAGLQFYDADVRAPFVVELKLRNLGSHWQVVEIANLPAVQKTIEEATKKRLDEINAPIRRRLLQAIEFVQATGFTQSDSWGIEKKSSVRVRMKNTSGNDIAEVHFDVAFISGTDVLGRISCIDNDPIAAGGQSSGVWSKDANQFIAADMKLYNSIEATQAMPEVTFVRFADGSTLELQTALKRGKA
jgi:hypothetical protein